MGLDKACEHQQVTWDILTVNELPLECMIQLLLVTLIEWELLVVLYGDDKRALSSVVDSGGKAVAVGL